MARRTVAIVPTLFTLGNLLCGFASIFAASRDPSVELPFQWSPLTFAAIFIFIGLLCDGLDGSIARLTRSLSEMGAQLDSMADMVTFGIAPAFLAVQLVGVQMPFFSEADLSDSLFDRAAILIAGIYVVCAALRLARFNVELGTEDDDHSAFKGLPSPGAAGTVASLALLHQHFLVNFAPTHWLLNAAAVVMVAIMLLVALAMVSSFNYVHVMNRYIRGRAPINTFAQAVIVVLLLAVYPQHTIAGAFVLYALSAPVAGTYRKLMGGGESA